MASIIRLADEKRSIHEVAKTINLAFSHDPLIQWLRPGARPWGDLESKTLKWQKRRIQKFMCNGLVLSIKSTTDTSVSPQKSACKSMRNDVTEVKESTDFGAVVMLEPPQRTFSQKFKSLWRTLHLWFLDRIDPCEDPGSKYKRIEQMLQKHDECLSDLRLKVRPRSLWYLEVIALRPLLHGQGLGGRMLREVIELAKGDAIMLECTDESNIGFYQRYGFEIVGRTHLRDVGSDGKEDTVSYPVMLRR